MNLHSNTDTWKQALLWGFAAALLYRLILSAWMIFVWVGIGPFGPYEGAPVDFHNFTVSENATILEPSPIPVLESPVSEVVFGVWRRWDALHYLHITLNGYTLETPHTSVFLPAAPLGIRALDIVLPGPPDLASAVLQTLLLAGSLTLLYRIVMLTFDSSMIAQWTIVLTLLHPLAYILLAPMTEGLFLFSILLFFYFAHQRQYLWAALAAGLATMTRHQGVVTLPVIFSFVFLEWYADQDNRDIRSLAFDTIQKLYPFVIVPVAYFGFSIYRAQLGFAPALEIHQSVWNAGFTVPVLGLWVNAQRLITTPVNWLQSANGIIQVLLFPLLVGIFRSPKHRKVPWLTYVLLSLFVIYGYVTWDDEFYRGTGEVRAVARYSLSLFPVTIFAADLLRKQPRLVKRLTVTVLILISLYYSGLHALLFSFP